MDKDDMEILSDEYSKIFNHVILWPLRLTGNIRFETKDGRFVQKQRNTVIRSIFFVILVNLSAAYMVYITAYEDKYLTVTEVITVFIITVVQNCMTINITFANRNKGLRIINSYIEIDLALGIQETKFMRDIATRTFVALSAFIIFCQTAVGIALYLAHTVSLVIRLLGVIFFFNAFLIFFDTCFLVAFHNFLSLRVHYINIAIIKLAKVNPTYFANQFFFSGLLWKNNFDSMITFHDRAADTQFIQLFGFIFEQLRRLERCFRFTIFLFMTAMIIGTFIGVQTIITHKQFPDVNILRIVAVASWAPLGWVYMIILSQPVDMFYRQLEKTKLICTYIQLKPMMSSRVLKLTKGVLRTLAVHEPRVSVYSMYYFNSSVVLQTAASIFVFVTVQLQLAAPAVRPAEEVVSNITDDTYRKTFLFR